MTALALRPVPRPGPRRLVSLLPAGGVLAAALVLAAGCGTGPAPANPPASSTSASGAITSTPSSAVSATPAAASSSTAATSAAGSSGTSASSGSTIPKTGLNPLLPLAGAALALVGATAVVGGWRRMRGASR